MAELTVGPVVTPPDVEFAVRDVLQDAIPWYLGEVDIQHDLARGTTGPPRLYIARSENERFAEEAPPVLVVASPDMVGDPQRHGPRGSYGAWFQLNIGVTVGGASEEGTRQLAARHMAAIMLVLGQQSDLGGLAQETVLLGGRIDTIPPQRTLIGCEVLAQCYIARVLDTRGLIPRDLPARDQPAGQTVPVSGGTVRVHPT